MTADAAGTGGGAGGPAAPEGGAGQAASAGGAPVGGTPAPKARGGIFRPSGLVVFLGFALVFGGGYWLFADRVVERTVEVIGTALVGARVDLESADLRLASGRVSLSGLDVTNPSRPMTNLVSVAEIVADIQFLPILSARVAIDELTVDGVRFGTERTVSGALPEEERDPEAGFLRTQIDSWLAQVEIPELGLDNLAGVVNTGAIATDSLRTVQFARSLVTRADSLGDDWERRLVAMDPRPRIDSVRAVMQRVEAFRPSPLNLTQVPGLLRDARDAATRLTSLQRELDALEADVRTGVASVSVNQADLDRLRAEDLAYARRLVNIPSVDAPTLSPALFGGTALAWMEPILYWARAAERFLPPGLDPRRRPGPRRTRASGVTYEFPEGAEHPRFLLEEGNVSMEIEGSGSMAGAYRAQVRALTSSPSLLGRPTEILLGREGGSGVEGISLHALLDHTTAAVYDSVQLDLAGVSLPEVELGVVGGRLSLGAGRSTMTLIRRGGRIDATMLWSSDDLTWTAAGGATQAAAAPAFGSSAWARDLIWRTLTSVGTVELEMSLSGELSNPSLSVRSNLGDAVSEALQRELGREIEAAEARVRSEVDQRIQPVVQEARGRVTALRTEVEERVAAERREVEEIRARIQARIDELAGMIPGG